MQRERDDELPLFQWATRAAEPVAQETRAEVAEALRTPLRKGFTFYLGTHRPNWLYDPAFASVPLFLSYHTLRERCLARKPLARSVATWAMDSGGFTELHKHGCWTISAREYATSVRRLRDEVGGLQWAAVQDWMCEESARCATGLSVAEHQRRTVDSVLELRALDPSLPWAPVLQGWSVSQYHDHVELYDKHGIDVVREPVVGLGSVCRRSNTTSLWRIVTDIVLGYPGIRLHGFGFKTTALRHEIDWPMVPIWSRIASADSLAWSLAARKESRLPGCDHPGPCQNCPRYALLWRERLLEQLGAPNR